MQFGNFNINLFLGLLCAVGMCIYATDDVQWITKVRAAGTSHTLVPVLVIGSGPAGLSAALYTARDMIYTVVLTGNEPGGQLLGAKRVENIPGIAPDAGYKIMDSLRAQTASFGVQFLDDTLKNIIRSEDGAYFVVQTGGGTTINALSVVIATGASALTLGVPGEQLYANRGVYTCAVCECRFMKDKEVVVIGGGDASIEAVMHLAPYAKQVTLLVRKDRMRAALSMQEKLAGYKNVAIKYQSELLEVLGDGQEVTQVRVRDAGTGLESNLMVQAVFECIGHAPNSAPFTSLIEIDAQGYIQLEGRLQRTSCPGIFAAGDVADATYRQAGVAAGDGIKAGLDAIAYLRCKGFSESIAVDLKTSYLSA